jgi:hypothetical protein
MADVNLNTTSGALGAVVLLGRSVLATEVDA